MGSFDTQRAEAFKRLGIKMKVSKTTRLRRKMVKALDDECKKRVLERDRYICQRCGARGQGAFISWSHVISRREYRVRWEDANSKALCRACHCWWENNKGQAYYWFSQNWPMRWEYIHETIRKTPKVTLADIRLRWESLNSWPSKSWIDTCRFKEGGAE